MAGRKMTAKRKRKKRGSRKFFALFLLLALAGVSVWGYVCSRIVHVDYVDVYVRGLSPFLEGATVLFASDLKITGENSAREAASLLRQTAQAKPDLIFLGGDYTTHSFLDLFRAQTPEGQAGIESRLRSARRTFFSSLSDLSVPGGIYAVAGDDDADIRGLYEDCSLCRATLLENASVRTLINNTPLLIVGYKDYETGGARSYKFSNPTNAETVLALCHNPESSKQISAVNDSYGNPLADLILCGHTLGGQANLFGWNAMSLFGGYQGDFKPGLYDESKTRVKTVVSSGVGGDWLPFRIGSRAQLVWITLHRK